MHDVNVHVGLLVHAKKGRREYVKDDWSVDTEGVTPDEMAEIAARAELHRGDPFDEEAYERSKEEIAEQLKNRGFAEAKVNGAVRVAPDGGTAAITYKLDRGSRCTLGRVIVAAT